MHSNCLVTLTLIALLSFGQCLKIQTKRSALRAMPNDFLLVRNAFYDCPNPSIMDGKKMAILNLQGAVQYCVDDPKCLYFQWNQDSNTLYHCGDDSFTLSKPRLNWIIGVKPEKLQLPGFQTTVNRQAVCGSELATRPISTLKEAEDICKDLGCSFLSLNLNKVTGSTLMTAAFCGGAKSSAQRDGFLVMDRNTKEDNPKVAKTLKAPCGLSGPVCSDDYFKDHTKGDIVNAKVTTEAPPPVV